MILNASAGKRRIVGRRTLDQAPHRFSGSPLVGVDAFDRRDVERRRQEVTTGVEQRLDPLFLKADPQITGTNAASPWPRTELLTRLRSAALISSS
jgi:hypothetical protein